MGRVLPAHCLLLHPRESERRWRRIRLTGFSSSNRRRVMLISTQQLRYQL